MKLFNKNITPPQSFKKKYKIKFNILHIQTFKNNNKVFINYYNNKIF